MPHGGQPQDVELVELRRGHLLRAGVQGERRGRVRAVDRDHVLQRAGGVGRGLPEALPLVCEGAELVDHRVGERSGHTEVRCDEEGA